MHRKAAKDSHRRKGNLDEVVSKKRKAEADEKAEKQARKQKRNDFADKVRDRNAYCLKR